MKKTAVIFTILICFALLFTGCGGKKVENLQITIPLASGERSGTYTGEVKNDKPDGNGKFESKNTQGAVWTYEGGFKDGTFDGQGKMVFPNQSYEGTFEKGNFVQGSFIYEDTLIYEGGFTPNTNPFLYSGKGKLYTTKGTLLYEGNFEDGHPQDKQAVLSKCEEVSYESLVQNSDAYLEQFISVKGTVKVMMNHGIKNGEYSLIGYVIALDNSLNKIIFIDKYQKSGEPNLNFDDKIVVYGQYTDFVTYTSVEDKEITLPSIRVFFIDK